MAALPPVDASVLQGSTTTNEDISAGIDQLALLVGKVQTDLTTVKVDLTTVQTDVATIKADVAVIKTNTTPPPPPETP